MNHWTVMTQLVRKNFRKVAENSTSGSSTNEKAFFNQSEGLSMMSSRMRIALSCTCRIRGIKGAS